MVVVELRNIQDRAKAAVEFLESKTRMDWKLNGTRVEAEEARARDVKLLLHKFLHREGLTNHRVLAKSGALEIVPVQFKAPIGDTDKVRGVPPFPPVGGPGLPGLQTVYPNYPPIIRTKPPKRKRP